MYSLSIFSKIRWGQDLHENKKSAQQHSDKSNQVVRLPVDVTEDFGRGQVHKLPARYNAGSLTNTMKCTTVRHCFTFLLCKVLSECFQREL